MLALWLGLAFAAPSMDDPETAAMLESCAAGEGSACDPLAIAWAEAEDPERATKLWIAGCKGGHEASCDRLPERLAIDSDPLQAHLSYAVLQVWQGLLEDCEETGGAICRFLAREGPYTSNAVEILGHGCTVGDKASCKALAELGLRDGPPNVEAAWMGRVPGHLRIASADSVVVDPQSTPFHRTPDVLDAAGQEDCRKRARDGVLAVVFGGDRGCRYGAGLWFGNAETHEELGRWDLGDKPPDLFVVAGGESVLARTRSGWVRYVPGADPTPIEFSRSYDSYSQGSHGRYLLGMTTLGASPPWGLVLIDARTGAETPLDMDAMAAGENVADFSVAAGRVAVSTTHRFAVFDLGTGAAVWPTIDLPMGCLQLVLADDGEWAACWSHSGVAVVGLGAEPRSWTFTAGERPKQMPVKTSSLPDPPLRGSVYHPDGMPEGVEVVFLGAEGPVGTAIPDDKGNFERARPENWMRALQARAPGWLSETFDYGRSPGREPSLKLKPAHEVEVQTEAGASVVALGDNGGGLRPFLSEATADAEGRTVVQILTGKPTKIIARGAAGAFSIATLPEGEERSVEMQMGEGLGWSRRFVDEDGEPIAGVRSGYPPLKSLRSGSDGWLAAHGELKADSRGTLSFVLGDQQFYSDHEATTVVVGSAELQIPRSDIDFTVSAGAHPSVLVHESGARSPRVSEGGGNLYYKGLIAGKWALLSTQFNGNGSAVDVIDITRGSATILEPSWSDAVMKGRVLDTDGWPAMGAVVWGPCISHVPEISLDRHIGECSVYTGVDGQFEINGLAGQGWKMTANYLSQRGGKGSVEIESLDEDVLIQLEEVE